MKKEIKVVGAAIIKEGRLLVAQRPYSDKAYKSLKWEFPGGKIEPGETKEEAIMREIKEELDCEVKVEALMPEIEHAYPDFILKMTICICHLVESSVPKSLEHNSLRWFTPSEFPALDWAAADALCFPLVAECIKEKFGYITT